MAIIPKYVQQRSVPGTTGQAMVPLSLAETSPLKTIGDFGAAAGQMLAEAGNRVARREETLDRTRKFSDFQTEIATEWQRVQDQEDTSLPQTLSAFNNFVAGRRSELINQHAGGGDSRAKLESQLEIVSGVYERTAISEMRNGQISALQKGYGDRLNPIIAGVTNGSIPVEAALQQINELSADLGGSDDEGWNMPRGMAFDMHDAAQSAVAVASVERHLSTGDWRSAQAEFDRHPEFESILSTGQLQKMVKRIGEQRAAYQIADQQARQARDAKAQDLGFGRWAEVPQSWKLAIATKQPIPGMEKFAPQTDAGKAIADRNALSRLYGDDSEQVKQFDQITKTSGIQEMASTIGKLHSDKQKLEASGKGVGDPAYDAVEAAINDKNPEYQRTLELKSKYPSAVVALDTFTRQAESMRDNAKKAIMMWTGKDSYPDALKAAVDGDFAWFTTGLSMRAAEFDAGSDVNEIKAILMQIGGKQMINALAALKASSPTGASGMGALNETEGKALMFQEGALDIMAPATTIETLIGIVEGTESAIAGQKAAFQSNFNLIRQPTDTDAKAQATSAKISGGTPQYDLTGKRIDGN